MRAADGASAGLPNELSLKRALLANPLSIILLTNPAIAAEREGPGLDPLRSHPVGAETPEFGFSAPWCVERAHSRPNRRRERHVRSDLPRTCRPWLRFGRNRLQSALSEVEKPDGELGTTQMALTQANAQVWERSAPTSPFASHGAGRASLSDCGDFRRGRSGVAGPKSDRRGSLGPPRVRMGSSPRGSSSDERRCPQALVDAMEPSRRVLSRSA